MYWTAVGEGELLTRITVPLAGPGTGDALEGVTLGRHGTYIVSVAASVTPDDVRIALGCVVGGAGAGDQVEDRLRGAR